MKKFIHQKATLWSRYPNVESGISYFDEDGWIAYSGNIQCGMFDSKEDAEMALLKIMFAKNFDEIKL